VVALAWVLFGRYYRVSETKRHAVPELWVSAWAISSSANAFSDGDAVRIDVTHPYLVHHDKWRWAPIMDGQNGVLVIHPLGSSEPARLVLRELERRIGYNMLRLRLRGSLVVPGVELVVKESGQERCRRRINNAWENVSVPLLGAKDPAGGVVIEVWPVGWDSEYCYIDMIELLKDGERTAMAARSSK
jgi:hypothetical protein